MSLIDKSFSYPVVISFNSKDRTGGTNPDFVSNPVDLGVNNFDSVCLVSASVPKSFFNMPTGYNTFTLTEITSRTITIPPGNYNRINLLTVLQTQLNTGAPVGWSYAVTYPDTTGADTFRYTFTVSGNGATQPRFIFSTIKTPFRQLGFEDGSTNIFTANSLTSTNAINLSYVLRAFIKSNICINAENSILEELLNFGSFPSQSVMYYQQFNFDMNTRELNPDIVNSWNFSLVDSFDQLIDLNGIPWAFSLVFYQRNNTDELHKSELRIRNEERLFAIESAQRKLIKDLEEQKKKEIITADEKAIATASVNIPPSFATTNLPEGVIVDFPEQLYPIKPFTTGIYTKPEPQNPV
jgi:hypothetical protein